MVRGPWGSSSSNPSVPVVFGGKANSYHDLVGEAGKKLESIVKKSPTFVRYHMKNCGHCVAMEGEWKKLAKDVARDKRMNVDLVNLEQSGLAHVPEHLKKNIVGFPTLVSYAKGGLKREEYNGERLADSMKGWLADRHKSGQAGGGRRRSRGRGRRHTNRRRNSRRRGATRRGGMRRRGATRRRQFS